MSKAYDDLLNVQAEAAKDEKAAFVEESKKNRTFCYEKAEEMTQLVVGNEEHFQQFLNMQSRFDRYTPNNVLLIMAQEPDAIKIGDYGYWKDHGAYIKRGEEPILILEPGKEYTREDGSIGTYYNAKKLYDVSQTTYGTRITPAEVLDDRTLVRAIVSNPPVSIVSEEPKNMPEGKEAVFLPESDCILVKKGMGAHDIFRSLVPELVYAGLADGDRDYDKREDAMHANGVTYMLCKKYGIEPPAMDFGQVPAYFEGKEPKEIRSEFSQMRESMNTISGKMSKVVEAEKQKAKNDRGEAR